MNRVIFNAYQNACDCIYYGYGKSYWNDCGLDNESIANQVWKAAKNDLASNDTNRPYDEPSVETKKTLEKLSKEYEKVSDSRKINDMKTLTFEQERELVRKAYNIAVRKLEQIQSGIYTEDDLDDYKIEELKLLINQFPYGISAQKDLLYLCIELGWIKEDMVSDSRKVKDSDDEYLLQEIARQLEEGYHAGYEPQWDIDITVDGMDISEFDDYDQDLIYRDIAYVVKEGYDNYMGIQTELSDGSIVYVDFVLNY